VNRGVAFNRTLQSICQSETVIRVWGGGSKGWDGWTDAGEGWHKTSVERDGDPDPSCAHVESSDITVGSFRSPSFRLSGDKINFRICGWDWRGDDTDAGGCFLRLARDGSILRWAYPPNKDGFEDVEWFVRDMKGQEVYIEVADRLASSSNAWIGVAQVKEIADPASGDSSQPYYALAFSSVTTGIWTVVNQVPVDLTVNCLVPGRVSPVAVGEESPHAFLSSLLKGESPWYHSCFESQALTGQIRSPAFILTTPVIRLALRGSGDGGNRIELIDEVTGEVLRAAPVPQSDDPKWTEWQVADLKGKQVCIRVVDAAFSGGWTGLDEIDAGNDFHVRFTSVKSLSGWRLQNRPAMATEKFGIPFLAATDLLIPNRGAVKLDMGFKAKRLFLLGMNIPEYRYGFFPVWPWLGDKLGVINVIYSDGVVEKYPLIVGESLWLGRKGAQYPEPFISYAPAMEALASALRLYPQKMVADGAYLAVLKPRDATISSIELVDTEAQEIGGMPVILGLTVEPLPGENISGGVPLPHGSVPIDLITFMDKKPLRSECVDGEETKRRLEALCDVMYSSEHTLPSHFSVDIPVGYSGPIIRFSGDKYAEVLTNIFTHNVADMAGKINEYGMFSTSTKNAPFYGMRGFGTFRHDGSFYCQNMSWSRDMSRSLENLVAFGYLDKAMRCADYSLKQARIWEELSDNLKVNGHCIPRHLCRVLQLPNPDQGYFENDGHGLFMIFIYNLWRHLPNRDEWLRSRWEDVEGLGDWIVWQLEHPEISGDTDRLAADTEGFGLYSDTACIEGLLGLIDMAQSIARTEKADKWKATVERLKNACEGGSIEEDPKFGKVWKLEGGFGGNGILAPIFMSADRIGLSPDEDSIGWRKYNEATYDRRQYAGGYGSEDWGLGYGPGLTAQSALLLDRMNDASGLLRHIGTCVYLTGPGDYLKYTVPECVHVSHDGYIARNSDLGNAVQQAEVVKVLRIIVGVDDSHPTRLRLLSRLPFEWTGISTDRFPALIECAGQRKTATIKYAIERTDAGMQLDVSSDTILCPVSVRLGAFEKPIKSAMVLLDGVAVDSKVTKSGDSWWVTFIVPQGTKGFTANLTVLCNS